MRNAGKRPISPSTVIALVALFVALGGTAYAVNKIDGSQIKPNSVTGKQVREPTLKGVKSARKVSGLKPFQARMTAGQPDATLFKAGPFVFKAECRPTMSGQFVRRIYVTTSENDTAIRSANLSDTEAGDIDFDIADGEYDIVLSQEVGSPQGPFGARADAVAPGGTAVSARFQLAGRVLSNNVSDRVDCLFFGYAISSK